MLALAAIGSAGWFVFSTSLVAHVPRTLIVAAASLGAALVVAAADGIDLRILRSPSRPLISAITGTMLAFLAAPLLVLLQRSSDAPSGSESLFFSLVAWGVIVAVASMFVRSERPAITAIGAAVAAATGAAGVLANWERPSSFSPLVKFADRELVMIAAGVLFAVGTMLLLRAAQADPKTRPAAFVVTAVVAAIIAVPGFLGTAPALAENGTTLLLAGIAFGSFGLAWTSSVSAHGPAAASSALMVGPVLITALTIIERAIGVLGPDPVIWRAALPAALVCVLGSAALFRSGRGEPLPAVAFGPLVIAVAVVALAAVVTLGLPALQASVEGITTDKGVFRASWEILGFQSAAGWLTVAAALLVLTAAFEIRTGRARSVWSTALVTALACIAAYPFLLESSFATWNRWIPSEVQQAYGTEYARLTVVGIAHPMRTAVLAAASVLAVAVGVLGLSRKGESAHKETA